METDVDAFARILRSFRERRDLSQRELATTVALDHKTVMAYERSTRVPRTEAIVDALAEGLELDGAQTQILRDAYLRARMARRQGTASGPRGKEQGTRPAPHSLRVYISSTLHDLPLHRKEVLDACLRQSLIPIMTAHPPIDDATAEALRTIDDADIYVGVFIDRYGTVPKGVDRSIAEIEYDRAVARGIPRLLFLADATHPPTTDTPETTATTERLRALKKRLLAQEAVRFFTSPTDLRAEVLAILPRLQVTGQATLHANRAIAVPPAPYIAHPYILLQTGQLIGRQAELDMFSNWVGRPARTAADARVLAVVGIGGMGKSALTWTWFNAFAPNVMPTLAGRIWWSFYESDAHFENFVIRALAYVIRRSLDQIQQELAPNEREDLLLQTLDREPFLIVLDGLERILLAYARTDAAYLADDDLDGQTANTVRGTAGAPEVATAVPDQHRLRKTIDPRAGAFLRRLATVRASRILISTRLAPADLQTVTSAPLPGCQIDYLPGLHSLDALALWRSLGVSGAGDQLLPLFDAVENHPLVIQVLAGTIAHYRPAPNDFDQWRRDHLDFDPARLPLIQRKSHVLAFALRALNAPERAVLETIAAVRMPATYDVLAMAAVSNEGPFTNERGLDVGLTDLEDRGLVGWDRMANRYDLHPIVRSVVWDRTEAARKREIYTVLQTYFGSQPKVTDWQRVEAIDNLTATMEWYHALIGLERYDDAYLVFSEYLSNALLYRLSANRERAALLEQLFPDGFQELPRLHDPFAQTFISGALFQSYAESGRCGQAVRFYRQQQEHLQEDIGMINVGDALWLAGQLYDAEAEGRGQLADSRELEALFQEAQALHLCGLILILRGEHIEGGHALQMAAGIFEAEGDAQYFAGVTYAWMAQHAIWLGQLDDALRFADQAAQHALIERQERDFVRIARLQGVVALEQGVFEMADEYLHQALTHARTVNLVDEEIQSLIALAELHRRQGDPAAARTLLDDVWEAVERGPFPLFHADALNVLTQLERDADNLGAAATVAVDAYRLAWCDGPPYAYHWGLEAARAHLAALGATEPKLPPLDEARHVPMPIVDIDSTNDPQL